MSEKEENSPTEDPSIDPDKEARMLLNPPADAVRVVESCYLIFSCFCFVSCLVPFCLIVALLFWCS